MNYQMIKIAQVMQNMPIPVFRKWLAAIVGASLDTIIQVVTICNFNQRNGSWITSPIYKIVMWMSGLGIAWIMSFILTGHGRYKKSKIYCLTLFIGTWIVEGYLQWVLPVLNLTGNMWVILIFTWSFSSGICLAVKKYRRRIQLETGIVQVALWIEGVRYQVNALIDTGNQLYDPYRNRPVHILEKSVIEEVVQKENESYLYIPYQSLGKEAGILPVYCVEQLVIHTRHQEIVLYNQLVGLTDLTLNTHRSYQMLLHAEIMTAHQEGKMIC